MSLFKKKSTDQIGSMSSPELFIQQSKNGIADLQQFNNQTWGLGSKEEKWDVDMEAGKITFTFPDKVVTADIQVVGTLHNGSFMWGWDHPSVSIPLSRAAKLAKKWGEQNNQLDYTQRLIEADEEKAWEFTAVAARLMKASGTYSGANGDTRVYLTFGAYDITNSEKSK